MHVPACLRVGAPLAAVVVLASSLIAPQTAPVAQAVPSVAGKIVFLDPGHNAVNESAHNSRQVPTGRGGTKDCQASGSATNDGYPEHSFTWDTTLRIRAELMRHGVRTAMSRGDDSSAGPCVDQRAALASSVRPHAIVSIHADGGPASGRGFHILYSNPPLNQAQAGPAVRLAQTMRDQLVASGIPAANYIGTNGLNPRSDIAGLNLAQYPAILVELGNMKNPADSGLITTDTGRQKYASAVVRGIVAYLATQPATT